MAKVERERDQLYRVKLGDINDKEHNKNVPQVENDSTCNYKHKQ